MIAYRPTIIPMMNLADCDEKEDHTKELGWAWFRQGEHDPIQPQNQKTSTRLHLKSTGGDRCGTVLFCDAVACVAVRRLVVAEAASDHAALFEVCRAALARVAAHAVLSAARLQDGLPGYGLPVLHIHKQPNPPPKKWIWIHIQVISHLFCLTCEALLWVEWMSSHL